MCVCVCVCVLLPASIQYRIELDINWSCRQRRWVVLCLSRWDIAVKINYLSICFHFAGFNHSIYLWDSERQHFTENTIRLWVAMYLPWIPRGYNVPVINIMYNIIDKIVIVLLIAGMSPLPLLLWVQQILMVMVLLTFWHCHRAATALASLQWCTGVMLIMGGWKWVSDAVSVCVCVPSDVFISGWCPPRTPPPPPIICHSPSPTGSSTTVTSGIKAPLLVLE